MKSALRFSQKWLPAILATSAVLGSAAASDTILVRQKNKAFSQDTLTVVRGGTVEITNEDPFVHHLFIENPQFEFDSGTHRPGGLVRIRFDKPGEYTVQCGIHLKMKLNVEVSQ